MQYTQLGRTGLKVSRLCLGTGNFGAVASEADSCAVMDRALEAGINFFDTANVYGGDGLTERVIGRWFAQGGGRREKTVIATKVFGQTGEWPNESKLSALNIRRACDASLSRLQTDHIDLYQMHQLDRDTPWDEIWQAMEILVQQGKVIYIGSSNFAGWNIAQANEAARRRSFLGLVSEQCKYSLVRRLVEMEVLPACDDYGLGVMTWAPLTGGVLGGALGNITSGRRSSDLIQGLVNEYRPQLEAYEALCAEIGEKPAHVAVAWVLANPIVTAPIIGPRTVEQLEGSLRALDIELSTETLQRLDEIFPGPGAPAPETWLNKY